MNLDLTIILIVAVFSASSSSNPVIYRINVAEPELIDNQDTGKWMGNTRNNYFRDVMSRVHPETTYIVGRASPSHSDCKHQYVQNYGNVGQPVGSVGQQQQTTGYRVPVAYPYPYQGGYPAYYYYNPGPVSQNVPPPGQQQQQQKQQQEVPHDQYLKPPVHYEKVPVSTTVSPPPLPPQPTKQPNPISGFAPITYPPIATSTWQNYLCSVFPYLATCQAQTQQSQVQVVNPYGYQPYPGYQQMAQYPVYYIVQPEVKPQAGVVGGPAPVGVIKITGPTPVKSEVGVVGEKPPQVVEVEVDVKKPVVENGVKTGVDGETVVSSSEGSEAVKVQESGVKKPVDD